MHSLVVSTEWLQSQMNKDAVSILDASWYLPSAKRDPRREWTERRIPGAAFFDIDGICRKDTSLPHMLPLEGEFAAAMAALGVSKRRPVVVYDTAGLFSATRALWSLRAYGHEQSYLLSGGLPKWATEGRPIDTAVPVVVPVAPEAWALDPGAVWQAKDVIEAASRGSCASSDAAIVDARPLGRYTGEIPEPRPGVASGHIPGSRSLPFSACLNPRAPGEYLPPEALRRVFEEAGVDVNRPGPVVFSCGSGVTACVVWAAARIAGRDPTAPSPVYDGSWSEYGAMPGVPIALGLPDPVPTASSV